MAARVRNRSKNYKRFRADGSRYHNAPRLEHVILRFKHPSALKGWALFLSRSTYEELELT